MKINWKPILVGFVEAFARPQDQAVIKDIVVPAAENIVSLFQRPPEAPPLTEADVRAALADARLPWQRVEDAAREELQGK